MRYFVLLAVAAAIAAPLFANAVHEDQFDHRQGGLRSGAAERPSLARPAA